MPKIFLGFTIYLEKNIGTIFCFFLGGNWIVGLSGFKLMELNIMQFVFQVQ